MKPDNIRIIELETKLDYAEFAITSLIDHVEELIEINRMAGYGNAASALSGVLECLITRREKLNSYPGGKS